MVSIKSFLATQKQSQHTHTHAASAPVHDLALLCNCCWSYWICIARHPDFKSMLPILTYTSSCCCQNSRTCIWPLPLSDMWCIGTACSALCSWPGCQLGSVYRLTNNGKKTRTERKGLPAFSCLVEVLDHSTWRVHSNVAVSVDALLANKKPTTQLRQHKDGKLIVRFESAAAPAASALSHHGGPWLAQLFQLATSLQIPTTSC